MSHDFLSARYHGSYGCARGVRACVRARRAIWAFPSDRVRRREEINRRAEGSDNGLSLSAPRLRFAGGEAAALTDMLMCLTESRDGWGEEERWRRRRRKKKDADARRLPSSLPPATRPLRALADSRPVMKPGLPCVNNPSPFSPCLTFFRRIRFRNASSATTAATAR